MAATCRHSLKWNFLLALSLLLALPSLTQAADTPTNGESKGSVARGIFTSGILDREPIDDLATVPNTQDRVYFFSDLRNLEGQIVTHRWEYHDKVMAEIKFKVGGPRWRVYSSKNILPEWTGQWTVIVTDENDWPIKASVFEYTSP